MCIRDRKLKYDQFGVLMRANTQSRAIEEAFLEANIPYTMSGGTSFFQRKEIKDIIGYLRVIANHDDDVNLIRIINVPRRGIGRATLEILNDYALMNKCTLWTAMSDLMAMPDCPFSEKTKGELESFRSLIESNSSMISGRGLSKKVRALVEEINYWDYLIADNPKSEKAARFKYLNIESLIHSIENWENNPDNIDANLYTYLNRITLLSRDDGDDENDKGKVNLMTIHASKGLEFPVVFIAGVEDGLIPHARSVEENDGDVEEERRLFYVAITRARDKLFLTSCQKRRKMQSVVDCTPSRFLDEIPVGLVEYHEPSQIVSNDKAMDILENMKKMFGNSNT